MRKSIFFAAALAVTGVAAVWFWTTRGGGSSFAGERLVPADAVFYAAVPDVRHSALRFPKTALGRLWAEPEVAAFAEKPIDVLIGRERIEMVEEIFERLKPSQIFFAMSQPAGVDGYDRASASMPFRFGSAIAGFQYRGGAADIEECIESLCRSVAPDLPAHAERLREDYHGVTVNAFPVRPENFNYLYWAATRGWGFVATSRMDVVDALDRLHGRAAGPSLADNAEFRDAMGRLDPRADFVAFVRNRNVVDWLSSDNLCAPKGFRLPPTLAERLRSVQALAYSLKFDGPDIRDTLFASTPGKDPAIDDGDSAPLALRHGGMNLTSDRTLGYFDFHVQPKRFPQIFETLAARNVIDPALLDIATRLPEALDGEISAIVSWTGDGMPRLVFTAQLADPEAVKTMIETAIKPLTAVEASQRGNVQFYHFPQEGSLYVNPALAIDGNRLVASLSQEALMLTLAPPLLSPELRDCEVFEPAREAFQTADEGFAFIDARGLVERGLPLLRQLIQFRTPFVSRADGIIDPGKIPSTETLAAHMRPWIYAQSRTSEGIIIRSSGTVPVTPVAIALAVRSAERVP